MNILKISVLTLIFISGFVAYIFISTGYFRSVENKFDGEILDKLNLVGAEDIMISHSDSFALISSTKRFKKNIDSIDYGNLFLMNLKSYPYKIINLTERFNKPFAPHGISMFKTDSTYTILAINHTEAGHSIEKFSLIDTTLTHIETITSPYISTPNDVVLIDQDRYYFTNDHKYENGFGRICEDYLGLSISNVIYYDGRIFKEVAKGIAYANGINWDKSRSLLYVASPRKFLVKVYGINKTGDLHFVEDIYCSTGVDNIDIDEESNLWIGAHPNLLKFSAYTKGKEKISPSEIIKIKYKQKGDYSIEKIFEDDGNKMSAATVAVLFGDKIFTGNVMDDHFLILKLKNISSITY